ncbi:MAG: dTDP-4-dehydrorhamnose reductase [Anaerolineales bacterium]
MRILLLGNTGQLGWELHRTLSPLGQVIALDYPDIDLTQPDSVRQTIRAAYPELIVNATAYTAVDRAEQEPETALAINGAAPGVMAEQARKLGAALIHYSTDYVFDGRQERPYVESDEPNPLGVYGQSKLAGERAVQQAAGAFLILRTSWVYSTRRSNFVLNVLDWARRQPTLRIVSDQVSNPTWARMLAEISAQVVAQGHQDVRAYFRERSGLYHLAGDGYASRLDWAKAALRCDPHKEQQVTQAIQPAATTDFPTPAERPLFSALNCDKFASTFGLRLPPWEQALRMALEAG